ncbi:PKD domain-containing protein [Halorussus sp. MSC15.2]|uniref:PKD domain-containing protein n=1 Tax=Halorussus sp. MSC15.2 TaxID=2283638 RepID=UPI0013D083C6|nr:PKD domain-containing protein [Halorussus sp. MSC15.2]NEU56907.1 PKD domain-containing protein [Halorussus sp. MSC15.2]
MSQRARSVLLTLLLVVSTFSTVGVGAASATAATSQTSFHVTQAGQCYDVAAYGNGDKTVEEFYDYRKPNNTDPSVYTYSSHGTKHLQKNQVSNLFFYHGSDGYSVVLLHDKLDQNEQNGPNASTITFTLSNMGGATWEVRDDNYTDQQGDPQDDNWDTDGPTHEVDWMWASHRTDGGAFTGIGEGVTIDPQFNDAADHWGTWDYSGDSANRTDAWRLLDAGGENVSLDMQQNLTVRKGSCPDTTSPDAALSASPNPVANDEAVTLDASNSTDDGGSGIAEYRWDFDGDGETDRTTGDAAVNHTYTTTGNHTASVTVEDGAGNADSANVTVRVEEADSGGPVVTVTHPKTVNVSETFEVSANATDESKVEGYTWEFGSTTKSGSTVTHSYAEAGEHNVTVTWTESDGETDSREFTIEAVKNDGGDTSPSVSGFEVTNSEQKTVRVYFWGSPSISDIEVGVTDEGGNRVATLTEGDFNVSDGGDPDFYDGNVTVASNGTYTATLLKAADSDGDDAASGQNGSTIVGPVDGDITYINGSAIRVNGTFERVGISVGFYGPSGYGQSQVYEDNVSGTTVITASESGVNGSMINVATADKDFDDAETELRKENPRLDYYAELIEPRPVNVSVENVAAVGNGTYEVTFGYHNPNDEALFMDSTLSGNVSGDAPQEVASGDHTFTVTWTPDSDGERATWTLNRSNFDQSDVSAQTKTAGELNGSDGGDTGPTAAISGPDSASVNVTAAFDAGNSTDDSGVVNYTWTFDGSETKHGEQVEYQFAQSGKHTVALTVEDAAGNTDTATKTVSVPDPVEFINATAFRVNGDYGTVWVDSAYYTSSGPGESNYPLGSVNGSKVFRVTDEGQWGPVVVDVALYEGNMSEPAVVTEENPDFEAQYDAARPDRPNTFVENATKVDDGAYKVTFGYVNPNDEAMRAGGSEFAAGNTATEPPVEFETGRHTFTATWNPASNDSNLVWETDFSNFGLGTQTATSPTPDQITDGEMPPTARLTADPTAVAPGETVSFDAAESSDDSNVTAYEWDFDGDGTTDLTTDEATVDHAFSAAGTYHVTVTVVDESGQSDTATESVVVRERSTDDAPTARLTAPDTGKMSLLFYPLDASASTDDEGIESYRWDIDGDGEVEWYDDNTTSFKPYIHLDGPGTYQATVIVEDTSGQTDTATVTYTVEKVVPNATVSASAETVSVGENVTFTATDPNQHFEHLRHFAWKSGPERATTWTTSFDEPGQHTVELVLRTRAGAENVVTETVTVTAADDGNDGSDDGNDGDDGQGGYDGGDNTDSRTGGIGPADPEDSNDESDSTVSAPLRDADGRVGTVVVSSSGPNADPAVRVTDSAPEGIAAPTVEDAGFVPLSYANVSGAEQVTVTVSKARLNATGAGPNAVSLFRYENGTWATVETVQRNATADAYEFRANVSDGTYAVGVGQPVTSVADASVGSQRVEPGDSVRVSATVENTGRADGTHRVELTVDGEVVATKTVSVEADGATDVAFSHAFDAAGVYEVGVGDETAEITVKSVETTTSDSGGESTTESETTDNSSSVPGFGVGVSLVALLAAALVALRRS